MKTKTYIWGLLGSMMLAGCATEDIFDGAVATMPVGLTAYVNNEAETTRMAVSDLGESSPGEEVMNENLLNTIDVFFYPHASDMTEAAVYHLFEKVNMQNRWTLTQAISDADLKTICGVTTLTAGDNCTVYILANYGADENGNSKFSGTETREQLRQMKLEADFNPKSGDTFLPQDNFVMEGTAMAELTGQGIFTLSGQVPLRRVASKVRLAVTIAPQAEAGVTDVNGTYTWVPQPETMKVMLTHGVNKGIVCTVDDYLYDYPTADAPIYFPKETENEDAWTTYGRNMDQTSEKDGKTWYEHEVPFYSYRTLDWKHNADNEAYLSLSMRWVHQDDANKGVITYYQIPIAQRLTDPSLSLKSYRYYRTEIELGVMGSFDVDDPVTLKDNSYIIVDWGTNELETQSNKDDATVLPSMVEVAYLAVQANRDTLNNVTSHGVPYTSSHEVSTKVTKVEFMDYSNVTIYKWTIEKGDFGMANGQALVYKVTRTNISTNAYEIYYLREDGRNYRQYQWRTEYQQYKTVFDSFGSSYTDKEIVLTHAIPDDMYVEHDVTVEVTNEKITTPETIVFTQYPPIYIDAQRSNGYVFVNEYANGRNAGYVYDDDGNQLGSLTYRNNVTNGTGENNNPNNYIINISALSSGSNYMIGDSRGERDNLQYLGLTNYYPGKRTEETKTLLAPAIMIASSYAKTQAMSRTSAEKRCASFQENGYPAGRWRLPTYAEVEFIVSLSNEGYIPSLFQTDINNGYWCAYGRIYGPTTNTQFYENSNINVSVRCVYDIWYWGEEPYQQNATNWLDFQD